CGGRHVWWRVGGWWRGGVRGLRRVRRWWWVLGRRRGRAILVLTPCPPLPLGEGARRSSRSFPSPEGRGDQRGEDPGQDRRIFADGLETDSRQLRGRGGPRAGPAPGLPRAVRL